MQTETITYTIKTADSNNVFTHLVKCDEDFMPKLSEKVDILAYAKKIVENSITFEAWINDELVGLIAAYFNDSKTHCGFITSVSTLKKYAGKGIASQLMSQCISYALQHQFVEIALEVFHKNNSAVQLYKKYGFSKTGINNDFISMKIDLLKNKEQNSL